MGALAAPRSRTKGLEPLRVGQTIYLKDSKVFGCCFGARCEHLQFVVNIRCAILGPTRPVRRFSEIPLAVDAGESFNLSNDQARRLGLRFGKQYSTSLTERLEQLTVEMRVSIKHDGCRRYGSLESIDGATATVKLEGRAAEIVVTPVEKLLRRRNRLSRSLKKRWARELVVMGGPSAIGRAYRTWVKELKPLLVIVRHKSLVLSRLARDHDVITLVTVRTVCGTFDDITEPDKVPAILFKKIISTSEPKVLFKRRRGRHESYTWIDKVTRERVQQQIN